MSNFWNKPKSLYDLADDIANRISQPDSSDYPGSPQQLYKGGGGSGSQINPPHVNAFFDSQHDRISQLANEMNVPPNYLLGLSAGESSWGQPPQGQNNLFGFSDAAGKPLNYPSYDASVNAFRNSQWFDRLQNKASPDDFVNELLDSQSGKNKYNSVNPNYGSYIHDMINTIDRRQPIWEQSR